MMSAFCILSNISLVTMPKPEQYMNMKFQKVQSFHHSVLKQTFGDGKHKSSKKDSVWSDNRVWLTFTATAFNYKVNKLQKTLHPILLIVIQPIINHGLHQPIRKLRKPPCIFMSSSNENSRLFYITFHISLTTRAERPDLKASNMFLLCLLSVLSISGSGASVCFGVCVSEELGVLLPALHLCRLESWGKDETI